MKQTVLDVLMFLTDGYLDDDPDSDCDSESLRTGLLAAGFDEHKVTRALEWLEGLADLRNQRPAQESVPAGTMRLFSAEEMDRLNAECRGFLLYMEQTQVLAPDERELVMDRVMALQQEEVSLPQLKWIVLMVLLNLPGRESSAIWIEDLVRDEMRLILH
jgi:Smg protein